MELLQGGSLRDVELERLTVEQDGESLEYQVKASLLLLGDMIDSDGVHFHIIASQPWQGRRAILQASAHTAKQGVAPPQKVESLVNVRDFCG